MGTTILQKVEFLALLLPYNRADSAVFCNYAGGGSEGTYYYSDHNGTPVVTSASVTITPADMDKVCVCIILKLDHFHHSACRARTPRHALRSTLVPWMMMAQR